MSSGFSFPAKDLNTSADKMHFLSRGTEFYVTARDCYYKQRPMVAVVLFHHAMEFFLKAVLIDSNDLTTLKKFSHNLIKLWDEFKKLIPEVSNQYDQFIKNFDPLQRIEYPQLDRSHKPGFSFTPTKNTRNTMIEKNGKVVNLDLIHWSLEEIDEIISQICKNIKMSPPAKEFVEQTAIFLKENDFFKDNKFFIKPSL